MYKVLYKRHDNGKLLSAFARNNCQIEYKPNVTIYADQKLFDLGYGICVFEDLWDGESFVGKLPDLAFYNGSFEIWAVSCGELFIPKVKKIDGAFRADFSNDQFDLVNRNMGINRWNNWPQGTWMARWITLDAKIRDCD